MNGTNDKRYIIISPSSLDICSLNHSFSNFFLALHMMHVYNSVSSTNTHSLGFNWQSFSPFTQYALLFFSLFFSSHPVCTLSWSHSCEKLQAVCSPAQQCICPDTDQKHLSPGCPFNTHTHTHTAAMLNCLFLQHCSICINTLYPLHKPYGERNLTCVSLSINKALYSMSIKHGSMTWHKCMCLEWCYSKIH